MVSIKRRQIAAGIGAAFATGMFGAARAAMGPNDKFDLVIKGGEVLDPSQNLRARRDVGIRFGIVEGSAVRRHADLAAAELAGDMHHRRQPRAGMDAARIEQRLVGHQQARRAFFRQRD